MTVGRPWWPQLSRIAHSLCEKWAIAPYNPCNMMQFHRFLMHQGGYNFASFFLIVSLPSSFIMVIALLTRTGPAAGRKCSTHTATALNAYTGQNPRRHVVLINSSQMRTILYTNWMESVCLFMPLCQLLSWGWPSFVDFFFHL
jgi:hypothetical protein